MIKAQVGQNHVSHFLNRQLSSDELEAALGELTHAGFVTARSMGYVTTCSGREIVAAQWEEFFPA